MSCPTCHRLGPTAALRADVPTRVRRRMVRSGKWRLIRVHRARNWMGVPIARTYLQCADAYHVTWSPPLRVARLTAPPANEDLSRRRAQLQRALQGKARR